MDDVATRDKDLFFNSLYDLDDTEASLAQESRSMPSVKNTGDVPGPPKTCAKESCLTTERVAGDYVARRFSVLAGW